MNNACKKIIFPLDVPDKDAAQAWVKKLKGRVGVFKVGLELFVKEGPDILAMISDHGGAKIFLDLKFHDIPATMAAALKSASAYHPLLLTIHPDQGDRLREGVLAVQDQNTTVLGVTVLTSIGEADLPGMGMDKNLTMENLVDLRVELAQKAGCGGIVCSGLEVKRIRERFGKKLVIVTPGIRPLFSLETTEDQQRIATPAQALRDGSDYLVIGRPIRKAPDPLEAVARIVEEMGNSLEQGAG